MNTALPLMAGDVFQQLYNVVDTLIVGRYAGVAVLAAVRINMYILWGFSE